MAKMRCDPRIDATAILLAGGKSSRMGQPKALLPFDGEPLIVHIVRKLGALFAETIVVAAAGQDLPQLPATLVRDDVPYQGPVGGIYYGLKTSSKEIGFVTSCDVPFISPPLVGYLISQMPEYDAVVPRWQERLQPLHAAYRRAVLPLLEEQLERRELRPVALYKKVRTREVLEDEIRLIDPEGLSFINMNTPAEYEEALKRWDLTRQRVDSETTPPSPDPVSSITCTVELLGVARLLTQTSSIALSLTEEATLSHVYMALSERLPVLVGRVIAPERNRLCGGYACNINGLDFARNPSVKVHRGDRIFIISADAGG